MRLNKVFTSFALAFAVSITAFSCKSKEKVQDTIGPTKMQQILLDINLAEAYSMITADSLHQKGIKNKDSLGLYYKSVFAHHHITSTQFNESLDWYTTHPEEIDSIYGKIIPIVGAWQTKISDSK